MFFSLNKKFVYTILVFFLFTALLFVYTFYSIYGVKITEDQNAAFIKSQQFVELLYNNINMRTDIIKIMEDHPEIEISRITQRIIEESNPSLSQETLAQERLKIQKMTQAYSNRYETLRQAGKFVIASSILMLSSILLLLMLIRRWVISPIEKISEVSDKVSSGILSSRIKIDENRLSYDEFDKLSITFNSMLEKFEENIKEIKNQGLFLQYLIDSIPDGIRVIDENGNTLITNQEFLRQSESANQKKSNLYNRHLAVNSAEISIQEHKYFVESRRDLSEDLNFMHQQRLSSLGFLGTSIAHEMKNHLGAVRIILEGLLNKFYKDVPESNETKKYLKLINKEIIECTNIPEILLKLAQFSQEDKAPIDCLKNIKEIISLLDYEAKKNGITVNIESKKDNITIFGLEADFKIIMLNLAQNAFKAMKSDGTLTFRLHQDSRKTMIELIDTGKGIAKNKIGKIFDPFYSEDDASAQKNRTGIGLAIVKLIVEKFGGKICVKSKLGTGTTFVLTFPLHK